jgi:hypothetical protein
MLLIISRQILDLEQHITASIHVILSSSSITILPFDNLRSWKSVGTAKMNQEGNTEFQRSLLKLSHN